MKKLFLAFLLIPAINFAQPATPGDRSNIGSNAPEFKFKEDVWDFGNIAQGVPVTHVFEFTSSGKEPVVVSQVTASCGCTTPTWTKEPVTSGKTGSVSVTFNAAREGAFTKTVTILSNTGEPKYLTIKGNVLPKKTADQK